jgi:hypothetical protein
MRVVRTPPSRISSVCENSKSLMSPSTITFEREKGEEMPLSRRTLWIGVALAGVAVVVLIAVFSAGGVGGVGY